MKKNIKLVCFSILALFLASCAKDKSNYDYNAKETISIKGLESSYTVVSEKESIVVNPEVTTSDANAELSYLWGIYETNVQGYAPVLDTIARTKNLNYPVKQAAKGWVLVFRVTNNKTGYSQYFTSSINVITEFTRGWYIAKDDGVQSDLDLFLTPTNAVAGEKIENVYSKVNGKKLQGTARELNFYTSYKTIVTGQLGNTRSLFFLTSKDASAMNINTLKNFRDLDNLFYDAPGVKNPALTIYGNSAYYMINDGQLHSIYAMSSNDGRFSARKLKDGVNSPYSMSNYFMIGTYNDPIFFDSLTSSFYSMSQGYGNTLTALIDETGTELSVINNNQNLLYMGARTIALQTSITGVAIFQDKTTPSIKTLCTVVAAQSSRKVKMTKYELPTTEKLYHATMYTVNTDESILYFVVGNQVWSRNLDNGVEILQYTAPVGEEITYIRHKKYAAPASDIAYAYNYVIVGTTQGGNYKMNCFTKSSGNLSATPAFTMQGTGIARDAYFISPSVSESTYLFNF